ncbi:hypothetical protein, partial [Actinobaculum suis]|uniref:hypothetical protein n=1 Tax=Actinobaculum suis TaxID=1657 RepID=UPI001C400EE7
TTRGLQGPGFLELGHNLLRGVLREFLHDYQSSCPTGAVTEDTLKSHGLFNPAQAKGNCRR